MVGSATLNSPATARRAYRFGLGLGFSLCLAGCASAPPRVQINVPFDRARAEQMLAPGENQIAGAAVLWLSSGGIVSCAGKTARLYPATPYAREWARLTYERADTGKAAPQGFDYRQTREGPTGVMVNQGFLDASRSTKCDADGMFLFERVADGDYFLEADIAWQEQIWDQQHFYYGNDYHKLDGSVLQRIHVAGGKRMTVDMRWSVPNGRWTFW